MRLAGKLRGVVIATLLVVCGACAMAPGAASAGTLDQQQADTGGGAHVINSTLSQAQTFTAGLSGGVDRVDLDLDANPTTSGPLSVEIRDVSTGGVPGSVVLASQSVPAASVPSLTTFVSINFTTPAPVFAGTQYAIVAYTADTTGSYRWETSLNDTYAGGGSFHGPAPSGAWTPPGSPYDFAFRTYVAPPPTITPPSNTFTFGKLKRNKRKGTALLTVDTPGPGTLLLSGKAIKSESGATSGPQSYTLPVISKGRTKTRLRKTGKVKVGVSVTFTPTGGTPNTQLETIKLIKKR